MAFNQKKALVGAFFMIAKSLETFVQPSFEASLTNGHKAVDNVRGQGGPVLSAQCQCWCGSLIKSPHCLHLSRLQPPALSICAAEARRDLW